MDILKEANGIRLPNFLPNHAFLCLLKRKVNGISDLPIGFVNKVWEYLEVVCFKVLIDHCGNYPQVLPSIKKASQNVIVRMKEKFMEKVIEMMEMEKVTDYTCDPDYIASCNKLMGNGRDEFLKVIKQPNVNTSTIYNGYGKFCMEGYGVINISHLLSVSANTRDQAFDLKMRMTAYWKIVLRRMVDWIALELRFVIQKMVNNELEMEIVNEVMVRGGGMEKMLDEPTSMAAKRERLQRSVGLLQESKHIIQQVMDGIPVITD
ncbi:hypothetical protein L2E82_37740 [Cichorium intybus]|uniref:Uncharacterized protein n=1 Tax=Cichorium intybus TaxID=13427 RepID=A0ACB9AEA8_CICIN|nr:hypothetical protein L2E82_37740 [Cichorium intybus]